MKAASWTSWLLAACVCTSMWPTALARYKLRGPPPPQIYKKSWSMGPRIAMGNSIHIGVGNYPHNRPSYKPNNYRIRRPPMFGVLPTWKTQAFLGSMTNHGSLPQRPPVKEFHSMNKVPEYSPEYRPEQAIVPPAHRGHMDDDKGPIHTIPAPNLSPADKPYSLIEANIPPNNGGEQLPHLVYPTDLDYNSNLAGNVATSFAFGTTGTSLPPQRTVTSPTPTPHRYEVTETNEIGPHDYRTVQPTFYTQDFDVTRLSTVVTPGQSNEVFMNHPPGSNTGLIGTNIQFGQSNTPMQTNLHSSLHVGFPGSAAQAPSVIGHQVPDLHVGHPAAAGPPLSATQLYDLLNSFPQQLTEQYTTGQQPQLQQHLLQQQLGQLFQPTGGTTFSQPQMHSFNYDEQANKRQQQQILLGQDYASGRVTADYNLEPEVSEAVRNNNVVRHNADLAYPSDAADQSENNIEYEETANQRGQSTYFTQVGKEGSIASQFYTTLPSREAAEKLAALAAAGNVNSHLLGQLRKQHMNQQISETMPPNHKDDNHTSSEEEEEEEDGNQYDHQQQFIQQKQQQEQQRQEEERRPLRIMVPDLEEYTEDLEQQPSGGNAESTGDDYEYDDNETTEVQPTSASQPVYRHNTKAEFGTRIGPQNSK